MLCLCSRPLIRLDAHLLPSYLKFRLPLYQLVSVALAKTVTGYTLGGKDCRVIYITAGFFFFFSAISFWDSIQATERWRQFQQRLKYRYPALRNFCDKCSAKPQFSRDPNSLCHTFVVHLHQTAMKLLMHGEILPLFIRCGSDKSIFSCLENVSVSQ